jgi:branched-chain amino acid transport system substrate-binding protein
VALGRMLKLARPQKAGKLALIALGLAALLVGWSGSGALASTGGAAKARTGARRTSSPHRAPLVVCQITAESGANLQLGQDDLMGTKAYVKWVNSKGGVLGHRLKLVVENDGSSPANAARLVRKCVTEDKANFILGPEETGTMAAAVPVADALRTVMITQGSGWDQGGLTKPEVHSYAFPGVYDVFYQDDLDTAQRLIAPDHYGRVAVIQDAVPGGLPNGRYMRSLCRHHHCKVVGVQDLQPGQTDDTPQVLNLLSAKPDIIVLGLIPGPDTITAIKAIRAENPTIPISECSGCWTPGFLQAAGGPQVLHNVYLLASTVELAQNLPVSTSADRQVRSQLATYMAAMKAAGYRSTEDINNASLAWASGQALTDAIKAAHSTAGSAVMHALQHQKVETLNIFWKRTPSNYAGLNKVVDLTATWTSSAQLTVVGSE